MTVRLDLDRLAAGYPGLSAKYGAALGEAAAVCLVSQQHSPSTAMATRTGARSLTVTLDWAPLVPGAEAAWADETFATEQGAYGIAILLLEETQDLLPMERARKGTGFDYWLGREGGEGALFQNRTRLEVSGLRHGSRAQTTQRLNRKLDQMQRTHRSLPGYAVVVEFGQPFTAVGRR